MAPPGEGTQGVLLLVEDDDDQAFLLRRQMRDQLTGGLDMLRVSSLGEALTELEARPVRCVMLDLSLPDASGMEALTAIRAASPGVAVVVLTGTDSDDVGRQALALGAQDYLVKGQHGPDVVRRSVVFSLERAKRQTAEQERADVAHRLELVLETSAEGICTVDGDGAISFLNRTAMELFGVADDQLVGTPLHDFHVCVEDPCPLEQQLMTRQVLDAGEQMFRSPRGLITLEVRSRPVHDSGTGIGAVVCLSDVTDRRRALDALAEREAQLVEAQQLAHLGSWEWVPSADEMLWSDQMYRITGLDPADVRDGRRAIDAYLALVPEDERAEVARLFEGWTPDRSPVEVVHQLCRTDDAPRWMLCRASVRQIGGSRVQDSVLRVVGSVQDITEQKISEDILAYQAMHDGLTALPNRALLRDRLERMLGERQRDMVALVYMDIDDFKWVNDNLSHAAGDELLIGVAERLGALIRPSDTLARNSGDEFIMVCDRLPDLETVTNVVDRLQASLVEPFHVGGRDLAISMSMGLAIAPVGEDVDSESLIRDADTAMYRAKHSGGGRCEIFDEEMREAAAQRVQVQRELELALESDEIRPWYQPIVDLATGRVVGCEALARWEHPSRGLLLPADFLEYAAENDTIIRIDNRILELACAQVTDWNRDRAADEQLCLSVNVSARHVHSDRLGESVAHALETSGLPGQALCVEMTEAVIMEDLELDSQALQRVRNLGVRVAVDDFGTGASSLAHLSRLPVDLLKIDRVFIQDLVDTQGPRTALLRAIEALGHALGLRLMAKAVETEQESEVVRALGIDQAQGYLWGRPAPAEAVDWSRARLDEGAGR